MSSENAFPLRSDCPFIPIIPKIEGTLVPACSSSPIILPPPGPIYEVPIFVFPLPNPPSADFGCYALQVQTHNVPGGPPFVATVTYPNRNRTGQCQPVIDFGINFDFACPEIEGTIEPLELGVPGFIAIEVIKDSSSGASDECIFTLVPSARIPCPIFSPGSEELIIGDSDTGFVQLDISPDEEGTAENGACTFIVDILIEVPKDPDASLTTSSGPSPICCEDITVLGDLTFTSESGPRRYQINLETLTFKLPKTEVFYDTQDIPLFIRCNTPANERPFVPVSMTSAGDGCCPSFTIHAQTLAVEYPSAEVSSTGTNNADDCCSVITVMAPTNFGMSLDCSNNKYVLSYEELTFKLPTVSLGSTDGAPIVLATACNFKVPTSVTLGSMADCPCGTDLSVVYQEVSLGGTGGVYSLVCDVSLVSGSSLIVKRQELTFNCGLLTATTACG